MSGLKFTSVELLLTDTPAKQLGVWDPRQIWLSGTRCNRRLLRSFPPPLFLWLTDLPSVLKIPGEQGCRDGDETASLTLSHCNPSLHRLPASICLQLALPNNPHCLSPPTPLVPSCWFRYPPLHTHTHTCTSPHPLPLPVFLSPSATVLVSRSRLSKPVQLSITKAALSGQPKPSLPLCLSLCHPISFYLLSTPSPSSVLHPLPPLLHLPKFVPLKKPSPMTLC